MRSRGLAWALTILTVAMICVVAWRVNKGWPAGPKTYTFMVATLIVLVATIFAWKRPIAPAAGTVTK